MCRIYTGGLLPPSGSLPPPPTPSLPPLSPSRPSNCWKLCTSIAYYGGKGFTEVNCYPHNEVVFAYVVKTKKQKKLEF